MSDTPQDIAQCAFGSSHIHDVRYANLQSMSLNNQVSISPLKTYKKRLRKFRLKCLDALHSLIMGESDGENTGES